MSWRIRNACVPRVILENLVWNWYRVVFWKENWVGGSEQFSLFYEQLGEVTKTWAMGSIFFCTWWVVERSILNSIAAFTNLIAFFKVMVWYRGGWSSTGEGTAVVAMQEVMISRGCTWVWATANLGPANVQLWDNL